MWAITFTKPYYKYIYGDMWNKLLCNTKKLLTFNYFTSNDAKNLYQIPENAENWICFQKLSMYAWVFKYIFNYLSFMPSVIFVITYLNACKCSLSTLDIIIEKILVLEVSNESFFKLRFASNLKSINKKYQSVDRQKFRCPTFAVHIAKLIFWKFEILKLSKNN